MLRPSCLSSERRTCERLHDRCVRYRCHIKFQNCLISDVSPTDAQKYIDVHDEWSAVSKNTHIRHLRALYAFHIKTGHATLNPFGSVEFIQTDIIDDVRPKIIPVQSVIGLLQFALDNGYHVECASMTLVFFCGVRVDEASRLDWTDVHLEAEKPFVDLRRTKKRLRRINRIPENAVHWLRLCASKGPMSPGNYEKRMQRLRNKAKIVYPQNAARHCFCSYHIALHQDGAKTAILLGHPNPSLLYSTYREVVTQEDAIRYFEIVPKSVEEERKRIMIEFDQAEKKDAEGRSNCGQAVRWDGQWFPVIEEEEFDPAA
jgi:integrase